MASLQACSCFSAYDVDDDFFQLLSRSPRARALISMQFRCSRVTEAVRDRWPTFVSLEKLSLSSSKDLTESTLQEIVKCSNLHTLSIFNTNLVRQLCLSIKSVLARGNLPQLISFSLRGDPVPAFDYASVLLEVLSERGGCERFKKLEFSVPAPSDSLCGTIFKLCPNLEQPLSSLWFPSFPKATSFPKFSRFRCTTRDLSDPLEELMPNLRTLSIVFDAPFYIPTCWSQFQQLTHLCMEVDVDFVPIDQWPPLLTHLSMSFGDAGSAPEETEVDKYFQSLCDGCPGLEYCELKVNRYYFTLNHLQKALSALGRLKIFMISLQSEDGSHPHPDAKIVEISHPALERFGPWMVLDEHLINFTVGNCPKLRKAPVRSFTLVDQVSPVLASP